MIGQPEGIYVDDNSNLYIADLTNLRIQKWVPNSVSGATVADGSGQTNPNVVFSPSAVAVFNNDYYFADYEKGYVMKWTPGATSGTIVAGSSKGPGAGPDQLSLPTAITIDCNGNIYIADAGNFRIQKWAPGATAGITVAGGNGRGSAANQFQALYGLGVDGAGNVYGADWEANRVQKWAPGASAGVTVAPTSTTRLGLGSGPDQLSDPRGLFVDYTGTVYIVDQTNERVQKWAPGATAGVTVAGGNGPGSAANQLNAPEGVFVDKRGNIYVSELNNNRVQEWGLRVSIDTTFTPTIPGKYFAMLTDINGNPTTTDTFLINSPSTGPPSISISASATSITVCTPVKFTATPLNNGAITSYQWLVSGVPAGADTTVYSNNIWADGDQILCVMTTDTGCTNRPVTVTDTSNVIALAVDPQGHASVTIAADPPTVCKGSPATFTATVTNGASSPVFQWLVNGVAINETGPVYTDDSPVSSEVVYCLITSDASCGLAKSNSIPISVYPLPVIAPGQVFSIPHGKTLELDPVITGDVGSYAWTPATGLSDIHIRNPVADPPATTQYSLEVVSPGGCKADGIITVDVFVPLSIPNAFTPNGDGRNDVLYILGGPQGSRIRDFAVFNRYGQRVFQVHDGVPGDARFGWNGSYNGKPASPDTYVYIVDLELANGQQQVYKGTVILAR